MCRASSCCTCTQNRRGLYRTSLPYIRQPVGQHCRTVREFPPRTRNGLQQRRLHHIRNITRLILETRKKIFNAVFHLALKLFQHYRLSISGPFRHNFQRIFSSDCNSFSSESTSSRLHRKVANSTLTADSPLLTALKGPSNGAFLGLRNDDYISNEKTFFSASSSTSPVFSTFGDTSATAFLTAITNCSRQPKEAMLAPTFSGNSKG